jgi:predicted ATPase/class 3 adenylate cyclase
MRLALAAHDDVLRAAIESHDGWLFKHTGDGVCAAFASPRGAVDAAVDAQRKLELPVRMGIATGEAELRRNDYFGVVLNRAARVMAAGHGGQILLADSAASLLTGVEMLELGARRLRDVPSPICVFQVRAEGLPEHFPPLRTLDPTAGNLRPLTSNLVGRESDLAELTQVIRAHRLVTLTGVGGVGKTRLALAAATHLVDEFPDGIWVFELAAVTDPEAVPDAVAAVLGITRQPGKTLAESVAAALEGRLLLLVFDTCEHVLDAVAELIDAIFAHSATVKLLATSREGLGISDEQQRTVPSLDLTAGADSASVTLFVERAHAVAQQFSIGRPEETAAVVEICRRLDGIPLAIELAASRMASMSLAELRDRLGQRFRLLVGSRRGMERHQTLRHAVAWSYDLLEDAEQRLLERCSVFAGGFDLESACAVAGSDGDDEYVVLELLDALVRKSLVTAGRSSGRTRYSMLETIRQFGEELLVERGEAMAIRNLYARHFAAKETAVLALWDSPRQKDAYIWFAVELANLRSAWRWAADNDDLDAAAAIATYGIFLGGGSENYEPIAWAEELIDRARAVDHPRLAALYVAAAQCWMPGRIEDAVRYSEAGQREVERGRAELPFGVEGWLVSSYLLIGQPERMVNWCSAQLALDRDTHTLTRSCLALALAAAGSVHDAMAAARGLAAAAEATHNPYALCFALFVHATAFSEADPIGALEALRRGFAIAQDSGNRFSETGLAVGLSRLEAQCGDALAALEYFVVAIRNYSNAGNMANMQLAQAELAVLLDRLGCHGPAATIAGFALSPLTASLSELDAAIAHLRGALGDDVYESLARNGESMSNADAARYAYDQIDQARAALESHA